MSKRVVVAIEGQTLPDGRLIVPGALTVDKNEVPVIWLGRAGSKPIGRASEMERDSETGKISFEIEMDGPYEDLLEKTLYDAYILASPARFDNLTLKSGNVSEIAVSLKSGFLGDLLSTEGPT